MTATAPLWIGIPVLILALFALVAGACAVGLVLQASDLKRCPCPNCAAWRAEHMYETPAITVGFGPRAPQTPPMGNDTTRTVHAHQDARAELLTDAEHKLIADAGQLWTDLCAWIPPGPTREADINELITNIHAIQRVVMAQAARRAYPERYCHHFGQSTPNA